MSKSLIDILMKQPLMVQGVVITVLELSCKDALDVDPDDYYKVRLSGSVLMRNSDNLSVFYSIRELARKIRCCMVDNRITPIIMAVKNNKYAEFASFDVIQRLLLDES